MSMFCKDTIKRGRRPILKYLYNSMPKLNEWKMHFQTEVCSSMHMCTLHTKEFEVNIKKCIIKLYIVLLGGEFKDIFVPRSKFCRL